MKKPNWEIAHKDATHWDDFADVFCNKAGYWCKSGRGYQLYLKQVGWGTYRYLARPIEMGVESLIRTTATACANLDRKFIGIELDKGYFDIGVDRLAKALAK